MINIDVEVKGMDTLLEGLKKAPKETVEFASQAIKESLRIITLDAIKEAPVNKQFGGGNLRQSIRPSLITKLKGVVVAGANYSIFVHEGTRPHQIRAKNKKALANRRTNQFFGKVVNHPGTKANPFMQRAYDKNKTRIDALFVGVIDKVANLLSK